MKHYITKYCDPGGISVTYENGKPIIEREEQFSLPHELLNKLRETLNEEFDDVFFDPGKETHFTAEIKHELNPENYGERKKILTKKFQRIVEEMELTDGIEVHEDALAVNVKHIKLNKHLAADKFLKWLKEKEIEPDIFYVFGDSKSDLQIAEEFHSQGRKSKFIYTGPDELGEYPFEIIKTKEVYQRDLSLNSNLYFVKMFLTQG